MSSDRAESRTVTAGKWLLALVTPASALALGSVPVEALIVASVLAATSCGLLWLGPAPRMSRPTHVILIALTVLLGMTMLQAIPLPAGLCRVLSPATADIWDRALSPLHEPGPSWHPLSVTPTATRVEVLRGFFYGCVFLAALRVASFERGTRFLVRLIVASSTLMAFSALAHYAVSAERIFGVYRPRETWAYRPGHLAPLLNSNHLAAYLAIGTCVAFGALLSKRSMPRAIAASTTLVLAATSLMPASRGATGTLVFGLALTIALTLYSRRRFQSNVAAGTIVAACVVASTVIIAITLSEQRSHLLDRDLSKVEAAKRSLALIASSPWFGFGRGSFETVFSSVRQGTTYVTWTNPEDIVIQWLVEWGVPITLAGFGLLAWALRPRVVLGAVRPMIGPWVAILVTVLHDLADYHLEVPGVVALVACCAAIVVSRPSSAPEARRAASARSWPRTAAFASIAGAAVAIVLVLPNLGHTLAEDRRSLSAKAVDKTFPKDRFTAEIRDAMLRYPGEPFLPLMGAVRVQTVDGGSVVPWVGRALERNARFGRAHFVLARSLASWNPAQARLEYRLAYAYDGDLRNAIVKEALPIIDGPTAGLELIPDGEAGLELLEALIVALAPRLPSTAWVLNDEIERRSPGSIPALRRRVEAAVKDATAPAPWCVPRASCVKAALAATDELSKRDPDRCRSHVLVAEIRVSQGEPAAALDALDAASERVTDRAECQKQFIDLALETGQTARGDAALDKLVRSGCGGTAECIELYAWAASVEERRGHDVRAVRLYRRILDLSPDRDDLLERIGELGERDGLVSEGLDAYRTLSQRHPEDPRWPARMNALRARAQRGAAPQLGGN